MSQQADTITDAKFADQTEPFRRELLAHCYRMLGSVDDAEDVVQETYLRAWRSYGGFEGRSSVRTWLYQIATNTCLTARQHRARRALPSGLGGPGEDRDAELAGSELGWLQPMPDALVTGEADDPAVIAVTRDSLRLALIASFQYLPPRQRAVLLLREVLAFPAEDVARMLGTTTVAVKSALQRARARLTDVAQADRPIAEPPEPAARALLDQYIAAFEHRRGGPGAPAAPGRHTGNAALLGLVRGRRCHRHRSGRPRLAR
jgi:RNA polymerase sigma-70 factor (ECF subfamily)